MTLTIEPLNNSKHQRSAFSCGKESLDNYIRKQASQDLKKKVAMVFVLTDTPNTNIIAYYTLSSYTVDITELNESFAKKLPCYPLLTATLLGRLAVDITQQGKHLGEVILIDALKKAFLSTSTVASLAVVAEAIDENAVKFYQKYGFQTCKQNPLKLYLPMKSVEQLCQEFNI